ncbi:MAG: hypothetical protein DLM72_04425 [Candidatus Nitrosopolaris wilkensis]|nr:MAG: hypothetical protein DLM72_04425 [Candidatus Nitrosopolaris wilkensis]
MNIRYAAVIMSSNFLSKGEILTVQFVEKPGHFLKTEVFQTLYRSTELIRNSKTKYSTKYVLFAVCSHNRIFNTGFSLNGVSTNVKIVIITFAIDVVPTDTVRLLAELALKKNIT